MSRALTTPIRSNAVINRPGGDLVPADKCEHRITILLDNSTSMEEKLNYRTSNSTRIAAATIAMRGLVNASERRTTAYSLLEFNSEPYLAIPLTNRYDAFNFYKPTTKGATRMARGMRTALNQSPTRLVLLTDGEPTWDDKLYPNLSPKAAAIEMAQNFAALNIPIDTIAIGGADDEMLKEISSLTGGVFKRCENPNDLLQHFIELEPENYLRLTHRS